VKPRIAIPVPHSEAEYAGRALPQYEQAVVEAGGEPVVIPLNVPNQEIARLASRCDAILLPGSKADLDPEKYRAAERDPRTNPSDPARDNVDELLLQDAFNMRKPILGICYGLQALNVWRTGTLRQHIESAINHEAGRAIARAHRVEVAPGSLLAGIVGRAGEMDVNSSHHQSAEVPGDGLRIAAKAPDGVIEAIEGTEPQHFVLGVQWHPERTVESDEPSRAIFRAFVEAARRHHERPRAAVPDFETTR